MLNYRESSNTDYNGMIIEDMTDWRGLVCINDGMYTRVDLSWGIYSMLDLTLVSESLAGKCDWKVINQSTVGSDHFPISSTIGLDIAQTVVERMPRWKFKAANWEKIKEICHNRMSEFCNSVEDVEVFNYKLCEVLQNTDEEVIGKKKAGNRRKAVPWWNEECSEAISKEIKHLRE